MHRWIAAEIIRDTMALDLNACIVTSASSGREVCGDIYLYPCALRLETIVIVTDVENRIDGRMFASVHF